MNDIHSTAAATSEALSVPEEQDARIAVRQDWTPEVFQAEVEKEKAMRGILQKYMKDAMIKDHHYYSFKDGDKPALTQEGAHAICSLMKGVIGPPENRETYHDDGHYSVTSRVEIFNQHGERIATGDGICTTRESKYAYRWIWDNEVPNGVDKSKLKSKSGVGRNNKPWTQYQMPNQDLPDLYNTVLKMAVKRAKVAAVRQLPLVSELFVADDSDEPDEPQPKQRGGNQSQSAPPTQQSRPPQSQMTFVEKAVELSQKLVKNHNVEPESLVMQFLPEDVGRFEDLNEAQAEEVVPKLIELLNTKLTEKK